MGLQTSRGAAMLGTLAWALAAPAAEDSPTTGELGELAYAGIYEEPVVLRGGVYEGPPFAPGGASRPRVELAGDGVARGDLDGDGESEAAVLLLESSGGTGLNHYLAVVDRRDGELRNVATARLGDRIQIVRFAIEPRRIAIESVEVGPNDAMCCPTQKVRRTLTLAGGRLEEERQVLGTVGLADLEGRSWVLKELDRGKPPASGEPITLEFEEGRVVGSAACNRYFSDAKSEGGQKLSVGPVGATRRICPPEVMEDEQAFLSRLQSVDRFSFSMGRLVLGYEIEGQRGALLFRAAPPDPAS